MAHTPSMSNLTLYSLGVGTLIFNEFVSIDVLTIDSSSVQFNKGLSVSGNLSLGSGAKVTALSLTADSIYLSDGAALTTESVTVNTDMTMINGAKVTVPTAIANPKKIHKLDIAVIGTLTVDPSSVIDLDGKGYPSNYWSGPDFSADTRQGCHGGLRGNRSSDCSYGRYDQANFAGSGGYYYTSDWPGQGGGVASISANALVLDGVIRANGNRSRYNSAGAGGGLNVDVRALSGAGFLQANGGSTYNNYNYPAGGGGRISMHLIDGSGFTGTMEASGGSAGTNYVGGAGTVYVKDASQSYGHLKVDNGGKTAKPGSTPIRSVGRHVITSVSEVSDGVWRIEVSGNPWRTMDAANDWGLDGVDVDLDASEDLSPHYTVVSNTVNTLIVVTAEDLMGVLGNELVGVHTFETLNVSGGASAEFGEDRIMEIQQ
ncbi:MAG: hypothetical protein ABW168_07760 [Sedimenticola sp.]